MQRKRINNATGGCLHVFFEGWFVSNHHQVARAQGLFGQLWKEYALSDSRYLISDTFVLSAEILSVSVLGGLAWLMVYLIGVSSPYRHPVQAVICMGHIYSDLLYYATALLDRYTRGIEYCSPGAYYYWAYFFGMNFIWIIVPLGECSFIFSRGRVLTSSSAAATKRSDQWKGLCGFGSNGQVHAGQRTCRQARGEGQVLADLR